MTMRQPTLNQIRRQIIALERQLSEFARMSAPQRAQRLHSASDLLTAVRACDLYRLR